MNPEGMPPMKRAEDSEKIEPVDLVKEPYLPLPELHDDANLEMYIHEHGMESGLEGAKDHVLEILKIVKEDEQAINLITETLLSVFRYVESIYKMEINTKMLTLRWEGRELAEKVERHDKRRRIAHDALISSLISTTRYLNTHFEGEVPQTGIYNGDALHLVNQNRLAIADWAIELEHEILLGRSK